MSESPHQCMSPNKIFNDEISINSLGLSYLSIVTFSLWTLMKETKKRKLGLDLNNLNDLFKIK